MFDIRMSNVKLFEVRHSNDECLNDLNVKLVDVRHSNVKFECRTSNEECQTNQSCGILYLV